MPYGERQVDDDFRDDRLAGLSDSDNHLPERLERIASEIASELAASLPDLAERWYDEMARTPQLVSWRRPDVRELILPAARRDIGRELDALARRRRLPRSCPEEVTQSARLAAESELPLWATLQAYRVGHAQQWNAWSDAVERRGLPAADRLTLLTAGSDFFFAYADRCIRWAEIEYTAARELPLRRAEQRRVQLVVRLLEGGECDAGELGYDPAQWHLGLIVSGPGLEQAVTRIAARAQGNVLTVAAETATMWMWIGASTSPTGIREELAAQPPSDAATLAIGEPEFGVDGFRQTYRQAQVAAAIGSRLGRSVTRYADVALEDLAGTSDERAARFVARELGPLAQDTREARTLRQTLIAYFSCSQRASSAAAQLRVHERTIGNRLRRVEQLIGHPAITRAVELQVALRLHELVGARQPPAG